MCSCDAVAPPLRGVLVIDYKQALPFSLAGTMKAPLGEGSNGLHKDYESGLN